MTNETLLNDLLDATMADDTSSRRVADRRVSFALPAVPTPHLATITQVQTAQANNVVTTPVVQINVSHRELWADVYDDPEDMLFDIVNTSIAGRPEIRTAAHTPAEVVEIRLPEGTSSVVKWLHAKLNRIKEGIGGTANILESSMFGRANTLPTWFIDSFNRDGDVDVVKAKMKEGSDSITSLPPSARDAILELMGYINAFTIAKNRAALGELNPCVRDGHVLACLERAIRYQTARFRTLPKTSAKLLAKSASQVRDRLISLVAKASSGQGGPALEAIIRAVSFCNTRKAVLLHAKMEDNSTPANVRAHLNSKITLDHMVCGAFGLASSERLVEQFLRMQTKNVVSKKDKKIGGGKQLQLSKKETRVTSIVAPSVAVASRPMTRNDSTALNDINVRLKAALPATLGYLARILVTKYDWDLGKVQTHIQNISAALYNSTAAVGKPFGYRRDAVRARASERARAVTPGLNKDGESVKIPQAMYKQAFDEEVEKAADIVNVDLLKQAVLLSATPEITSVEHIRRVLGTPNAYAQLLIHAVSVGPCGVAVPLVPA
jgi:hypothetical protein